MHNIPFIPGGINNLSRDSQSISRDVYNQRFHLEGNFLPEGYFGVWNDWKEIWKEIARK